MKRIALLLTAIALSCASANAQSLLERLGQRAKNAAENNVGNKVEQGVNDLLNGKLGKKKDKKDQKQESAQPAQTSLPQDGTWTCPNPECGHAGNTGKFCEECGTKKPASATASTATSNATPQNKAAAAYAKSDFVLGDEIFFDDPVENEQVGEFPSRWDAGYGETEIVSFNDAQAIELHKSAKIMPLMNKKEYLPEEFTVEFDIWTEVIPEGSGYGTALNLDFKQQGGGTARWHILASSQRPGTSDHQAYGDFNARKPDGETVRGQVKSEDFLPLLQPNSWTHVAVSFNKRAFKAYINGTRVISIPNMARPVSLSIESDLHPQAHAWIKNFRMAQGAVPLYDRLASDGKIVTYAITFDTGKATLKPEADVEINRIKGIMDNDKSLKFEVQGHCDNTGSDAVNDPLSQKRAEAIVARLVELGISADRLTAVGKGSHEPIADNSSDEGRAMNRRVEFIKQ